VPQELWQPSRALRAATAVRGIPTAGLCFVMMWFFFPHIFLVPVTAIVAAQRCLAPALLRLRVRLDLAADVVAITIGFWTKRVPLTRIERVDEALRFGPEITMTGGLTLDFSPFRKHRGLGKRLRIRTGFEGMELAITRAAAAARAADPGSQPTGNAATLRKACIVCGAGLFSLAAAALVQPQTGGWLVHAVALLLRIAYGVNGAVAVLIGAWMLCRRPWRDRRAAGQPG
jgi:hypothetical protein